MRKELKKYIDEGEDDKTILASFSAKYGPKVLSAPATDDWFNLSAWVMPFVVLACGRAVVVFVLKNVTNDQRQRQDRPRRMPLPTKRKSKKSSES